MSKIDTKCVTAGYTAENGQAGQVPIYQSTTFKYDSVDTLGDLFDLKIAGHFYTRLSNPTNEAVENKINALEGGVGAMVTSAGQAASLISITNIASAGDHIISAAAIYGGTFNLFDVTLRKLGIETTFVDVNITEEELNSLVRDNTKLIFGETLTNPSLDVLDIEMFARVGFTQRNVTIASLSLAIGIGFTAASEIDLWHIFPEVVQSVFSANVVAVVFVVSIILNLLLPENMEVKKEA